ncbi:retinol dehydrogenase 14-like isoform X1 [Dreissena polymorpha]|nr:retinol dehydrogenase 14-like isoform X1 [Dreissena polymorpha]
MGWNLELPNATVCIGIAGVTVLAVRRAILHFSARCPSRALMTGKTVVITGANCGIGYETALDMANRQAHVILACRDVSKGLSAAKSIIRKTGNQTVEVKKLDLASFMSVHEFCDDMKKSVGKLDVLVNNAGVMNAPYALTEDGLETHMAVNHFSNVLLTNLLLELLQKPTSSRVVFVSSSLHKYGKLDLNTLNSEETYKTKKPYASSKLMNLLYARELQNCVPSNVSVYTLHPGMVRTNLGRHAVIFNKLFKIFCFPVYAMLYSLYVLLIKTAREGCQTVVYCAVSPELEGERDGYYGNCRKEEWTIPGSDLDLARKVYDLSMKVTKLKD